MSDKFSDFENDGFSAIIDNISLFDYMQLMMMTQKDKTIEINQRNYSGLIEIVKGKITFAETSTKKLGMDAIFEIMLLNTGNFRELRNHKERIPNIKDNGNILLQVAEYMDKIKINELKADKIIKKISIEEQISKKLIKDLNDSKLLEDWGKRVKSLLSVSVISSNGEVISEAFFNDENDKKLFLPHISFTGLLKDSIKIFNVSKLGFFEEFILESDTHYLLMKVINYDFFLQLIVSKKESSMGSLKLAMKKLIPDLKNYLVF